MGDKSEQRERASIRVYMPLAKGTAQSPHCRPEKENCSKQVRKSEGPQMKMRGIKRKDRVRWRTGRRLLVIQIPNKQRELKFMFSSLKTV